MVSYWGLHLEKIMNIHQLNSLLLLDDTTPDESKPLSTQMAEPTEVEKLRAADRIASQVGVTDSNYVQHMDKLGEEGSQVSPSTSSSSTDTSSGDTSTDDTGAGSSDDFGGMDDGMGGDPGSDDPAPDDNPDDASGDAADQPTDDKPKDTKDDTKADDTKVDDGADKKDDKAAKKEEKPDKPDDKEPKEPKEKPSEEKSGGIDDAKPAQESLRDDVQDFSYIYQGKTLYPYLSVQNLAIEAVDESEYTDRRFLDGPAPIEKIGSYAWDKTKQFGSWLKQMGVEYGPQVLSTLGEGVAFIMGKSARMLVSTVELVRRYVNTIGLNFSKLEKEVDNLIAHVTMAAESGHKNANGAFEKEKPLNMLLIGNSFNVGENVKAMTKFVDTYIAGLDKLMREEFKLTMHLMDMDAASAVHDISTLLGVAHIGTVLKPGEISGYEVKSELLAPYASPTSGMGNIRLCAHVPKSKLQTSEEFRSAYQKSTMFLAMDMHGAKTAQRIEYIDADELLIMLQNLKVLCGKCKHHQQFYKETEASINSLSTKMKTFFGKIVSSKKKLNIEDTTMELVYLKMGFVDRVYIPCAMDLHDYTAKVVAAAIDYSKHCLKSYT